MVRSVKLRKMGGWVGATLPKDLADRFHLKAGDEVLAVETAHGILEKMLPVASGDLGEKELAEWIRSRIQPTPD